jgi:hypothetical protein
MDSDTIIEFPHDRVSGTVYTHWVCDLSTWTCKREVFRYNLKPYAVSAVSGNPTPAVLSYRVSKTKTNERR